jgi:hypothetical protein
VADLGGYDPQYVPFFPLGKTLQDHQQLDPKQLPAFQEWSLARARALGQRFEITGTQSSGEAVARPWLRT